MKFYSYCSYWKNRNSQLYMIMVVHMLGLCFCANYAANNVKTSPISVLQVARSPWSIEEHINRTWKGFSAIRPSDILSRIMERKGVGGGRCRDWIKASFYIHIMRRNLQLPGKNGQKKSLHQWNGISSASCFMLTAYMALKCSDIPLPARVEISAMFSGGNLM